MNPLQRLCVARAALVAWVLVAVGCSPLGTPGEQPTQVDPELVLQVPVPGSAAHGQEGRLYYAVEYDGVPIVFRYDPQRGGGVALTHSRETGFRPITVLPVTAGGSERLLVEGGDGALQVLAPGQRLRDVHPAKRAGRFLRWADSGSSFWIAGEGDQAGRVDVIHVLAVGEDSGHDLRRTVWRNPGEAHPIALGPGGRRLVVLVPRPRAAESPAPAQGSEREPGAAPIYALQIIDLQRPTDEPRTIAELAPAEVGLDLSSSGSARAGLGTSAGGVQLAVFEPDGRSLQFVAPVGEAASGTGVPATRWGLWSYGLGEERARLLEVRSGDILGVGVSPDGATRQIAWRHRGRLALSWLDAEGAELPGPELGAELVASSFSPNGRVALVEYGSFVMPHGLALWDLDSEVLTDVLQPLPLTPLSGEPMDALGWQGAQRMDPVPRRYRPLRPWRPHRPYASTGPAPQGAGPSGQGVWIVWVADDDGLGAERYEPLARYLLESGVQVLRVSARVGVEGLLRARRALVETRQADPRSIGIIGWQRGAPVACAALAESGRAFAVGVIVSSDSALTSSATAPRIDWDAIEVPVFVALRAGSAAPPYASPTWSSAGTPGASREVHAALPDSPPGERERALSATRRAAARFVLAQLGGAGDERAGAGSETSR